MKLRRHQHGKKKKRDAREIAAQLAPPEEQAGATTRVENNQNGNGSIIIDKGTLKLPQGLDGNERKDTRFFDFDPVIIIIFVLSLAFIIFITVLISRMPTTGG